MTFYIRTSRLTIRAQSETQDLEAKTRDCRRSHALERAQLQGELEQAREVLNDIRNDPQVSSEEVVVQFSGSHVIGFD